MDGSRMLVEAQARVARWLESEPGVQLIGESRWLAPAVVLHVVEALNGDHVLILGESGWRLEHDLRCRIGLGDGCIVEEPLRRWMRAHGRPDKPPGRYFVRLDGKIRGQAEAVSIEPAIR